MGLGLQLFCGQMFSHLSGVLPLSLPCWLGRWAVLRAAVQAPVLPLDKPDWIPLTPGCYRDEAAMIASFSFGLPQAFLLQLATSKVRRRRTAETMGHVVLEEGTEGR